MKRKKCFSFGITALMLLFTTCAIAQNNPTIEEVKKLTKGGNYADANYNVTKPLFAVTFDSNTVSADPSKHKVQFEIMNFGDEGNTVLMTLDLADDGKMTYSWSGYNVHVAPGYDNGVGMLTVLRGSTICGILGEKEGDWIAILQSSSKCVTIGDLKKGMTRAEVEKVCGELGLSQFKFDRNSGNLKVYSLYWLDMSKQYNLFGTDYRYVMRNDKKYGDFYFDAQGKLVKWFLFI